MTKPTKPTVPNAPLRSNPATFAADAESHLSFWPTFATYLDDVATFTDQQADEALAAALAGDLPPLTGEAGNLVRVNDAETGIGFVPGYAAKAWVSFTGESTPTVNASSNVASVVRDDVGRYTVTFTQTDVTQFNKIAGAATTSASIATNDFFNSFENTPTIASLETIRPTSVTLTCRRIDNSSLIRPANVSVVFYW